MTRPRRPRPLRVAALVTAVLVGSAPFALTAPATAAEPELTTALAEPPPAAVLPSTTSPEYFDTPRDITECPYRTSPPAPVDESEVPLPGQTSPAPPPVPETPPGGDALEGCEVVAPDGFEVPRDVTASAWMISDLDTGEVVAARDPHGRYRPASLIKTLLATVALDALDADRVVTVTDEDLRGAEGSLVGIGPGGQYSVDRLVRGLLMSSGNDAALVLARRMGGVEATLEAMNAHAAGLGAVGTHAATVNGLDGPGMMSTAYDLSLIFRDAMTRPAFARIVATQMSGFPGYPAGEGAGAPDPAAAPPQSGPTLRGDGVAVNPGFVLANDNQLLYNYPGAIGGKTGFTDDARHTFIGAAERDGRRLVVVLLDGTRVPASPWEQAARLLDAGFDTDGSVGHLVTGPPIEPGAGTEHLASGPLGAVGPGDQRSPTTAPGSVLSRNGPWLAVVAAVVVVAAGAVMAMRSRR
ncbi:MULTISPECIES: D-alanyl-D-alanine carboxypeptidase family protein [unclassified Dietzia]|uniref:D-alanyl-D-alanine carboxypeptidase family protein n=1 Tax=unclassified Dietzia TaxID=2617939 RepID=UPI000D2024F4|nr:MULTISPECIES: D-alanyl-D-alanine carboxypeptidase family protein [unclassified Dietzia]AVZ41058.1 penicillin-binding protein [Dietzia sp. JS16-p6b]